MSIKLDDKNIGLIDEMDFPDSVDELNKMRDNLYKKMNSLGVEISDGSEELTEFYQNNIRQNRVAYIKENDEVYEKAKDVDNLVNEFNNTRILIELIEKKIEKHNK